MGATEPYDESKIVYLLTQIYKFQQLLCYYPEDSSIIYAPPSGHQIDEVACERLNLLPAVISFMKRIPYLKDFGEVAYSYPFINHSIAAVYTELECIVSGRDPDHHGLGKPLRMQLLKPSEVVLTFARRDSVNIFLDTDENTIRWWAPMEAPEDSWPEGSPESQRGFFKDIRDEDDWDHPYSYCPTPALQVLQELVDKYRTLEWIPKRDYWAQIIYEGIDEWSEAKRRLISDYGWPDQFDHDVFKKDRERFWWEVDPENQVKPPEST